MLCNIEQAIASDARIVFKLLFIIVILLFLGSVSAFANSINSTEEALKQANSITGFERLYADKQAAASFTSVSAITYVDETTPFIHDMLDERISWKITYDEFDLVLDSQYMKSGKRFPKACDIWLDSLSGELLRIEIRDLTRGKATFRMPTAKEAEKQMNSVGESFKGLPQEPPAIDLITALSQCKSRPLYAKEISIQYVLYSKTKLSLTKKSDFDTIDVNDLAKYLQEETFPAWIILMRGVKSHSFSYKAPRSATHTARQVINAVTGKSFGGMTNFPSPSTEN